MPNNATIPYPPRTANLQHEIELVIAIGKGGKDIAVGSALAHVFGYAVGNDLTRRDLQFAARDSGRPWDTGKAFDRSAPITAIQPAEGKGFAKGSIWLKVNGETKQQADVADLIWDVPEIIAELSTLFELAPGGSLRVHMARGDDSTNDLYVGQNVRWWNNDGDCAYLFDGAGAPVSTHCYGDAVARAGLVTPVTEPAATGDAQVAEVHHGADGHEHGDREWVLIVNNDSRPLQLAGWRLSDEGVKHSYTFGERILAPGASVRVHMARGDDGEADVYVGRNQRWWNNDGDCAYLHDGSGTLVHVHCYGDATASA